jgi:precorrin-2 dehydrogenase/sirohydrochlorin ferrochelatase
VDAFPAFFPLAGRKVVVAGSGEAADAKARLFDGSPADLVRLEGAQAFLPGAYRGAALAFIASADPLFAQAAARAARLAHVPVNVVDRPEACDFTTPALIDRGEVVAAIGTGGASPMLATLLRHDLEARVPEGAGRVAALFRRMQDEVRAALPDLGQRRAFLRSQLSGPVADAAMAGESERAEQLLREALGTGTAAVGKIVYVAGRGPVDLLTLRAVRALAAADVLAPDAEADPAVLALARRDADRLHPADASPAALVDLARAGRSVARILAYAAAPEELRALAAVGVVVEVPPTASE